MTDDEIRAVWAYMRSLPAGPTSEAVITLSAAKGTMLGWSPSLRSG